MNPTSLPNDAHWWDLVEACCDGTATDEQLRETEQLIETSAPFRQFYAAAFDLVAELHYRSVAAAGGERPCVPLDTLSAIPQKPRTPRSLLPRMLFRWAGKPNRTVTTRRWAMIAACVAIVIGGVLQANRWRSDAPPIAAVPPTKELPAPASHAAPPAWAKIARQRESRWGPSSQALASETTAPNGRVIQLDSGLVELAFACGATATVSGPSAFQITGPNALRLDQGLASVEVVVGKCDSFMVDTPTLRVVDRGTQFAVRVDPQGVSDVDVFRGAVETLRVEPGKKPDQHAAPVRLQAGEAVRVTPRGIDRRTADRGRRLKIDAPLGGGEFACWQAWTRTVRNDPALVAFFDFQPHPRGPLHLENLVTSRLARHGKIMQGSWDDGRWPEKWSLRFEPPQAAATIDLPGQCPEMTLAAWIAFDQVPALPVSLLESENWGARDGQMRWTFDAGGQSAVGVSRKASPLQFKTASTSPLGVGRWTHVALVWRQAEQAVEFFRDGQRVASQPIDRPLALAPGACRLAVGSTPQGSPAFRGRLGELLVFRRALSPAELQFVFEMGKPR